MPTSTQILTTYRQLLRVTTLFSRGEAQRYAAALQNDHTIQNSWKHDPRWMNYVRTQFRKNKHCVNAEEIKAFHNVAVNSIALLRTNLEHSKALADSGWTLKQSTRDQIQAVARRVGLEVTEMK